ncbi:MAG: hypothetical protein P1U62_10310, partial [Alteraurantiacibacter sp. bin_em_oilr2.035]|nr:hypothetical protein [Alteraurantiacibacter sp. bin_em_oilr2.035]
MQNETQASTANRYEDLITDDRVHSSLYTDDDVFEDEMTSIFRNGWVFICHESEISGPGDFVRRNV